MVKDSYEKASAVRTPRKFLKKWRKKFILNYPAQPTCPLKSSHCSSSKQPNMPQIRKGGQGTDYSHKKPKSSVWKNPSKKRKIPRYSKMPTISLEGS